MMAGRVMSNPIRGPATPISNKALRDLILPFILMMAPKVPKGGMGTGKK